MLENVVYRGHMETIKNACRWQLPRPPFSLISVKFVLYAVTRS